MTKRWKHEPMQNNSNSNQIQIQKQDITLFFLKKNVSWKGKGSMKKGEKVKEPEMENKGRNNYQFLKSEKMIDIYK